MNKFFNKRIPTLMGLLLVLIGIGVTSYLVQTGVIYIGQAAPDNNPKNIRVTNVSDTSFSISYETDTNVQGLLSLSGDKSLTKITPVLDDRDQATGVVKPYRLHHLTVRNLLPNTQYYFSIVSGASTFQDNSQPFNVTTGPTIGDAPSSQNPLAGKVITPGGNAPLEAIVFVKTPDAQTLSGLIAKEGNYIIPLNALRSTNGNQYVTIATDQIIQILVTSETEGAQASILASQINPVPIITIGNTYDFTTSANPKVPSASSSATSTFPVFSPAIESGGPQLLTPRKDDGYTDQQPLFQGTASPGANIQIIIHSNQQIETQIVANQAGGWSFRPSEKLAPGDHTITIITKDQFGIPRVLTQSFTVFAAGTQVNQSATPSATPTIVTPSPSPTAPPTPTPTTILSVTPTPTSIVLLPTTPPPSLPPTIEPTRAPLPASGSFSLTLVGAGVTITTLLGAFLFLFSRGKHIV